MRHVPRKAGVAGIGMAFAAAGLVAVAMPAGASAAPAVAMPDSFAQTNLIASSASYGALLTDPNLTNAWGLAASPTSPIWVADNNSGLATVYSGGISGSAVKLDLTVTVPGGNPTGQVFNSDTTAFPVGGATGTSAHFIVDTDSIGANQSPGEIAAWNGGASFVVEDSPTGGAGGTTPARAVFKGLALDTTPAAGPELFAADVANARIDVFNQDFQFVRTPREFRDPRLPRGYAPFNVQDLNGMLYVTYGKQNRDRTDVVPGIGRGFVDEYTVNGQLVRRVASRGPLDEPWGLAIAPAGFGPFGGDLLVGNLGNGWINVFNPTTGRYLGWLATTHRRPVVIDGLWGLQVGNSAFGGPSSVIFSSGPNNYNDGLVGVLNPAQPAGW